MPGIWTEQAREAARERLRIRNEKMRTVKLARIKKDAEIAARIAKPAEEQADDIFRMMFGNDGISGPILRGNGK